jgi:hypothetical protein
MAMGGQAFAQAFTPSPPATPPDERKVEAARNEFLALERPIEYRSVADRNDPKIYLHWIELRGSTKMFADKWGTSVLVYALWGFLDDPVYDAESTIILSGHLGGRGIGAWHITYRDRSNVGNWPQVKEYFAEDCKNDCRSAMNQPSYWYPHPVLFDRATVLAESATNAAVRANYIAAMVKVLADPKIRTENPLEVQSILLILGALKAREAASTFVEYMFYDWRTGHDFVLTSTNQLKQSIYEVNPPLLTCLRPLGKDVVPLILERFANASAQEVSCQPGGGALPVFLVNYFFLLGLKPDEAAALVEEYKADKVGPTETQLMRLDTLGRAIREGSHRAFFMKGGSWTPSVSSSSAPAQ